jgi:hypothetical protein
MLWEHEGKNLILEFESSSQDIKVKPSEQVSL